MDELAKKSTCQKHQPEQENFGHFMFWLTFGKFTFGSWPFLLL
jgi:hypothetical protein